MAAFIGVLQVLLPGGFALAAVMLFNAYRAWKDGKDKREETLLQRWQREVERLDARNAATLLELEFKERLEDWWRDRAASLEFQLRLGGIEVPAPETPMPSRRERKEVRVTDGT